jgi:GAF domain-containing protein/HAMP domain-containing protein
MIDRFLRRLAVRSRIFGAFLILVLLLALSVPLIVANQTFLLGRLRQVSDVEARADRALLLASARIESSRVNLMRYVQDYAPSAYEALDDVDLAAGLLTEAQGLVTSLEQEAAVTTILAALGDYRTLIGQVETVRSEEGGQRASPILFQAYRLGNDIGQRIEQIVDDSEARVTAANEAILTEAQNRLIFLGSGYVGVVILALLLASLIQRSITRPVAELRRGAEAFRQGEMDVALSVAGTDELSLLARTFNQMTTRLRGLVDTLEQRVAQRTHALERRAVQLAIAADVGRAAVSILEPELLTRQVVELIREGFDLYYAGLFLLDEEGRYAVLEAGTGDAGRIMKERRHRLEVGGISMVGAACAGRRARIALDVGEEPVRFDNPLLPETRSEMALPLMVGARVLGALDVQSIQPAAYSEEDIAVLQLVANQVAVAINNARLFAEVQAALDAERRAYGEISRQAWERMVRAQAITGYHCDERGVFPVGEAWYPQTQTARKTERAMPGQGGMQSQIMPIRIREQIIGAVDARKLDDSGEWTQEEIALLETLADQLGVALDSARLYQDAQRRAARERTIRHVTERMRRAVDVETILQTAVAELASALGVPRAYVRLGAEGGSHPGAASDGLARGSLAQPEGESPTELQESEEDQSRAF